jgi:putative nucleotidyltransferase with HDIG domain
MEAHMVGTVTHEQALELLKKHVRAENMIKHCLASEAVMRALAAKLGEDQDKWGLAGLLHDVDVELTNGDLGVHGSKAKELLAPAGVPDDVIEAIRMHNEQSAGAKRSDRFHKALAAGETITGLITATTLVYPDKKLASVKPSSITKRMKEKLFAAKVCREIILECEQIGIPLPEFAEMSLKAMQGIAPQLGL